MSPRHAEGPLASQCGPPAAFLDPPGDQVRVGSGGAAEGGSDTGPGLVKLTLASSLEDARHLGEQIRPTPRDLLKLGHCGVVVSSSGDSQRA
jgi:hypothetical protein